MLGILDRSTVVTGTNNYNSLTCSDTSLSDVTGAGDVLRFCKSGSSYVEGGTTGCATTIPATVKTHDEYYWGDYGPNKNDTSAFNETAQGGLAFLPGSGQLVSNGFDPAGFHEGGVYWLDNQTGADDNRYFLYTTETGVPYTPATMGKLSGLGDVEMILDPAPIEIGNRVWLDADGDGIQDAGEVGIPNVQVQLMSGASLIGTATTAADGTYYFSNATGTSTASTVYEIKQLQPNTVYTIHFPTTVTVSGTSYNLTTATAGSNTLIDSSANASGDVVVAATDIPAAGANNHSFDVGYTATATPQTDLKLVKTASKSSVRKGDTLTYTLALTNESTVDGTNVKVTDKLPAGVTYSSHNTLQGTYDAGTGIWDVGTVAAGKTVTLTIDVSVD